MADEPDLGDRLRQGPIPGWMRPAVIALGVPQLVVGGWAIASPRSWFEDFPGIDPRLVASEPPYNQHLATDAGAGFLAVGVALVIAGLLANRGAIVTALAAFLAHAGSHFAYHLLHPSDALTGGEDSLNLLVQLTPIVAAAFVMVVALRLGSRHPVGVAGR